MSDFETADFVPYEPAAVEPIPVIVIEPTEELPAPVATPAYQPPSYMKTFAMQTIGGTIVATASMIAAGLIGERLMEAREARKARKAAKQALLDAETAAETAPVAAEHVKAEVVTKK